jgi:hypothetical protein
VSEPRTETGRAFVAWDKDGVDDGEMERLLAKQHWLTEDAIRAIEAEARAALLDELEREIGALLTRFVQAAGYPGDHHGIEFVDRSAVLDLIASKREGK